MFKRDHFSAAAVFVIVASCVIIITTFDSKRTELAPQIDDLKINLNNLSAHEARVNSFTSSTQANAAVALNDRNGSIVVWDSRRQQGGTYGIFLQRYASDGSPLARETQVNLYTGSMQMRPAVAVDGLGGTWVAWDSFGQDGSMQSVIARRFDTEGFIGSDEILVNQTTEGNQFNAVIAPDSKGNATFVWTAINQKGVQQLVARRFDRHGQALTDEFALSASQQNQVLPTVTVDGSDRIIAVWAETDETGHPAGIFGRILDEAGNPISDGLAVTTDTSRFHIEPSVAAANDGSFSVCWLTSNGDEYSVYTKSFDPSGQTLDEAIQVSSPAARNVSGAAIAMNDDGQFVVAWNQESDGSYGKDIHVHAQLFTKSGTTNDSTFRVNQHNEGRHRLTAASGKQRVVWGSDHRLVFAWSGQSETDESSVNQTVMLPNTESFSLSNPSVTAVTTNAYESFDAARPHEPPAFNARLKSRLPNGGDMNPGPLTGEFGFIGITSTGWTPPDPEMAVGPNQIVAITNGEIAFFDKDGTMTFSDEIEDSFGFWGSVGAGDFVFDPEALYDTHSNRFFAMACERNGNQSYFLLAVSDDDNPNGSWFKYRFNVTPIAEDNIDSPNMGIDDQALYLTADFFSPDEYLVYILRKSDLLSGQAPLTRNLSIIGSQSYGIPLMYGTGATAYYMIQAFEFGNYNTVRLHAITDPLGTPQRVTTDVSVPAYGHPVDPPQMGTSVRPELFEARFWDCLYRDGSLWAIHHQSPNSTGTVRARWYEFDMNGWPTSGNQPFLVQSGDISPGGGVQTFFPSIWVDALGNAAITCARSNTNEFISMSRTLRRAGDPLGQFGPLEFVRGSTAASTSGRWGDYSKTMSDPLAPGTFWGVHEYTLPGNSWNTWIGQYVVEAVAVDIAADSFMVTTGTLVSGGIAELAESDDQYLFMNPQFLAGRYQNVFTVDATAPTDMPSVLEFGLEAKVANFFGTVDQKIELFNYGTGQFETVDNRLATASDSVVSVTPDGDPTRFVEAGTAAMRARIRYENSMPFWVSGIMNLYFPFRTRVDQIYWTITP